MTGRPGTAPEKRGDAVADIDAETAVGDRPADSESEGIHSGQAVLHLGFLVDGIDPDREIAVTDDRDVQMADRLAGELQRETERRDAQFRLAGRSSATGTIRPSSRPSVIELFDNR